MCGGRGSRLATEVEKPLVEIGGRPMVERVRRALEASSVETTYAVVSPQAPLTREYLRRCELPLLETSGAGYVQDLGEALANPRIDRPVLTVATDLPLLDATAIDDVLAAYERRRTGDPAPSMTVCVPVEVKQRLGLTIDDRLRADDSLAPTGLNVVGADGGREVRYVTEDTGVATNVNRARDARIAEALCD